MRASRRTATRATVPAAILRDGLAKSAASSERVKESPEGVARPQNVEYSTPKWGSRESKFPPGDLCRNVILPRHPKFDSFSRSQDEGPWGPILFARADTLGDSTLRRGGIRVRASWRGS